MILFVLVEEGLAVPYAIESIKVDEAAVDDRVAYLWRRPEVVGLAVLTEADLTELDIARPEALYLRAGLEVARCPTEWLWRGFPKRRVTLELCDPEQPFEPASPGPPPPQFPGRGYDTVTHCGCCRSDKEGSIKSTPADLIAEGRCPLCGRLTVGMTAKDIERMYFAYLRS